MAVEYDLPKKLKFLLKVMNKVRPDSETLTLEQIQKLRKPFPLDFLANYVLGKPLRIHKVEDRTFPARDGAQIPIRIYWPVETSGLPLILNYHGGGWVLGNLQQSDAFCRKVAKEAGAVVISVDYRLAPEHTFPTAANDCYDAMKWAHAQAEELKVDRDRIALMGDSAGGNLAAAVTLMSRDLNGPIIAHQSLIYPATNGLLDYPSLDIHAEAPILTKKAIYFYLDAYKNHPEDHLHPYFSPYLADTVAGLPPALVITAGYDPLKDDGRMYAERLEKEGVEVKFVEFEKEIHGFISFPTHSLRNPEAVDLIIEEMKRWLK